MLLVISEGDNIGFHGFQYLKDRNAGGVSRNGSVHWLEPLDHPTTEILSCDGLVLLLANGIVVRNHDHELIAQRLGLLEVVQVPCMEQVEDPDSHHPYHDSNPPDVPPASILRIHRTRDVIPCDHRHAVPRSVALGLVYRERTVAVRLQHLGSDGAWGPPR